MDDMGSHTPRASTMCVRGPMPNKNHRGGPYNNDDAQRMRHQAIAQDKGLVPFK